MPHCPICKTEYREGFTVCADCGERLAEGGLPAEGAGADAPNGQEARPEAMRPAWLMEARDGIESAIVTDVLRQQGIPAFAQEKETGGYMKVYQGFSVYGEDIYVDERDLDRAKEVLDGLSLRGEATADEPVEEEPEEAAFETSAEKKRAAKGWVTIILLSVVGGGALSAIGWLVYLIAKAAGAA